MAQQPLLREREEQLEDSGRFLRGGRLPVRPRIAPVPAPLPSSAGPAKGEGYGPRLAMAVFGLFSFAALFALGVVMHSPAGVWPRRVELVANIGPLAFAVPHIPMGRSKSELWYLVALGDPRVFVALAVLATLVALKLGGWRLAALCSVVPAAVMVLDEFVAKPSFFLMNGGHYGFPSGHVTAATTICAVFLLVLSARFGMRVMAPAMLVVFAAVGCALCGVMVLGMHPPKDALGGLLFGAGSMALFASALWRPRRRS